MLMNSDIIDINIIWNIKSKNIIKKSQQYSLGNFSAVCCILVLSMVE